MDWRIFPIWFVMLCPWLAIGLVFMFYGTASYWLDELRKARRRRKAERRSTPRG